MIKLKSSITYRITRTSGNELLVKMSKGNPDKHVLEARWQYYPTQRALFEIATETIKVINTYFPNAWKDLKNL